MYEILNTVVEFLLNPSPMYKAKTESTEDRDVHLHGWDSKTGQWHGPTQLTRPVGGRRATLAKLKAARRAFHGKFRTSVPGLPCLDFHTAAYNLADIGVAIVHLEGAHPGPVGIMAILPAARRQRLRADFPLEFVTLLSLFGGLSGRGSELTVHNYIEEVLRTRAPCTQIFTAETAELPIDLSIVLSVHFERLGDAMIQWLNMQDSDEDREGAFESGAIEACAPD